MPPIPPRRPTTRQWLPRTTTCTPCRASHSRSSNPVSGPRGASGRANNSSTAPWGGARSGGSWRSTRSRIAACPNCLISARTRIANGGRARCTRDDRGGATGLTEVCASTLRSRASARSAPTRLRPRAARAPRRADADGPVGGDNGSDQQPGDDNAASCRGIDGRSTSPSTTPTHARRPEPRPERRDPPVAVEHCGAQRDGHGVASSRSCSTRAGPMPGIASSSSMVRNGPCASRQATIFSAVTGPTPGQLVELGGSRRRQAGPWRSSGRARRRARGQATREDHLDAVGERLREVDGREIGLRCRPAGPAERVGDSRAVGEPVQAGPSNCTDDVDDEPRPARRRRRHVAGYAKGRRPRRPRWRRCRKPFPRQRQQCQQRDDRARARRVRESPNGSMSSIMTPQLSRMCVVFVPDLCQARRAG